ncbi:lycopene cyclase domain-containing protein [Candidatus Nephthysia bennettiae]|uniref:lycopene cyclase domain-containing protein n=1 Tax=Candidatus Nephthysia bennettiae TaxID=3127016 RepID=UPI0030C6C653
MREYTLAALAVLGLGLLIAGWAGLLRRRALWAGLAGFGLLTVIFDLLMTAVGLYSYSSTTRSGLGLGRMPVEDLLYGLGLYLIAVSAFTRGSRDPR